MKRFLIILIFMVAGFTGFSQSRPVISRPGKDIKIQRHTFVDPENFQTETNTVPVKTSMFIITDSVPIQTIYDIQSSASGATRIYRFQDGTIGLTCTMSLTHYPWIDRGTGYNYFNGTTWQPKPQARIETIRTGFPSYAPFGPGGEVVVSHQSQFDSLVICSRTTKGTGPWTQKKIPIPPGANGLFCPKLVTNGPDRSYLHILAMTDPVINGGTIYQGLDGAILYNHSLDGGITWCGWQILNGMTSNEYSGFAPDCYAFAEPKGNTLAFVYGSNWNDFAIMKSTDNGFTWTKTVIWSCPYDLWTGGSSVPIFYCIDGFLTAAIDNDGKVHISGGLNRASGDPDGTKWWYPWTDGLLYWNEEMPVWGPVLDSVILMTNGNYIGWVQDTAVWNAPHQSFPDCQASMTGLPTFVIDDLNNVYLFWGSVTNYRDPGNYLLRHIYGRAKPASGNSWCDTIQYITTDTSYTYLDCMFPCASPTCSDNYLYLTFQCDPISGSYAYMSTCGSQGSPTTNDIVFFPVRKADLLIVGERSKIKKPVFTVSQAVPNPANTTTYITVTLNEKSDLMITLSSLIGQVLFDIYKGNPFPGTYRFSLNSEGLRPGIYFYTVTAGNQAKTGKLVVR